MYIVLTKEEYDKLILETSIPTLFKDSLEHELALKEENIKMYSACGSKDIAIQLRRECRGMEKARELLLEIMKS